MNAEAAGEVWIVVLTWNGRADTLALLDSLAGEPARVVVVDNGSEDDTVDAVRERHPDTVVVCNGANLGYAGGNDVGIRHALDAGARIVMVLNNDTVVTAGFLGPLVAEIEGHTAPVAVSPDIRYAGRPDASWYRGGRIDVASGSPVHLPVEEQPDVTDGSFRTDVLSGCCIVATADVWRQVGLFDEGMFLIFEDSDWSMRARSRGVELRVVPGSRIAHRVSGSFTGTAGRLGTYYFARNGVVFAVRHLGRRAAVRFVRVRVLRPAARSVRHDRSLSEMLLTACGVAAALLGCRGPAGALTVAIAGRGAARRGDRYGKTLLHARLQPEER